MRKAVASVHADTVVKSLMRWAGIAADASSPIAAARARRPPRAALQVWGAMRGTRHAAHYQTRA